MPDNKKHHYVPRFYLKAFGGNDDKTIHLYNIPTRRLVNDANLKTQCYRDYFYGKDPILEAGLARAESIASAVIREIVATDRCPQLHSAEHAGLSTFTIVQHARTQHAADAYNEAVDGVAKILLRPQIGDGVDRVKIGLQNASQIAPVDTLLMAPSLYDLHIKLLVNRTALDFITSDHPVALHNQFYEGNRLFGYLGYGVQGLQIFFPLSPRHLLLFYDSAIYRVGNRRDTAVEVTAEGDIRALNELQWLNALANIYFACVDHIRYIAEEAARTGGRRPKAKTDVREFPLEDTSMRRRSLLYVSRPNKNLRLSVSCIRVRRRPPRIDARRAPPMRTPAWLDVVTQFAKAVRRGDAKREDFDVFFENHPRRRGASSFP